MSFKTEHDLLLTIFILLEQVLLYNGSSKISFLIQKIFKKWDFKNISFEKILNYF